MQREKMFGVNFRDVYIEGSLGVINRNSLEK